MNDAYFGLVHLDLYAEAVGFCRHAFGNQLGEIAVESADKSEVAFGEASACR